MPKQLKINEIFTSIHGESSLAGLPCTFIRLSGCSLRCNWCDTSYAYDEGEYMPIAAIIDEIKKTYPEQVLITGGEPLDQENVKFLIKDLLKIGKEVSVETSGKHSIINMPREAAYIIDIKLPSSGEEGSFNDQIFNDLSEKDELKFVICDYNDYIYARNIIRLNNLENKDSKLLMGTVFNKLETKKLVEWVLKDKLEVRIQLQLHKYIWPPAKRGV